MQRMMGGKTMTPWSDKEKKLLHRMIRVLRVAERARVSEIIAPANTMFERMVLDQELDR